MRWALLAVALVLLNLSLTFVSIWPTLGVRASAQVSLEAAVLVLGLAVVRAWRGQPVSARTRGVLAAIWVVLVIGRYIDVSTRSLYGRGVNLYWDLKLLPDVGAMFAFVAHPAMLAAVAAGVVLVPMLIYLPVRWAIGRVCNACNVLRTRRALVAAALLVLATAAGQRLDHRLLPQFEVAPPVSLAFVGEVTEFAREATGLAHRPLPPAPDVQTDLAHVQGADVFVLFIESYGAASWERPEFQAVLTPARAQLIAAIRETGRERGHGVRRFDDVRRRVVAGAHQPALRHRGARPGRQHAADGRTPRHDGHGLRPSRLHDHGDHAGPAGRLAGRRLLRVRSHLRRRGSEVRGTAIRLVGRHRPVRDRPHGRARDRAAAAEAGLRLPADDQHARPVHAGAAVSARLAPRAHGQRPTTTTLSWQAWSATPDWDNLGPGYARSMAYVHDTLGGYLRLRADRDFVMVILGDHQPPALVSGEGASWAVPVHVVTGRAEVLARLRQRGFRDGLVPAHPSVARMDTLMRVLLDAFGNPARSGLLSERPSSQLK